MSRSAGAREGTEPASHRAAADARNRLIWELARQHDLPAPLRLLDLGCGTTVPLREFVTASEWAATGASVIGLDRSASHVALARGGADRERLGLVQADSTAIPLASASVDMVTAFTLFSSLPTAAAEDATAAEIMRVLRPGGVLAWYDMRFPSPGNPDVHHIGRRRIHQLFSGCHIETRSVTVLPPLSRWLVPAKPSRYDALVRVPFLRSHLVAIITRYG